MRYRWDSVGFSAISYWLFAEKASEFRRDDNGLSPISWRLIADKPISFHRKVSSWSALRHFCPNFTPISSQNTVKILTPFSQLFSRWEQNGQMVLLLRLPSESPSEWWLDHKQGVSKPRKSRSSEVRRFCHYYNNTLLADTYVFDWTPGLLNSWTSPILV